jgi:hypothetical protein
MTSPDDRHEFGELGALLIAERPEVESEFARELDEWAAAGFPRGSRPGAEGDSGGGSRDGIRGFLDRLSAMPPRRILAPVGAAACLLVVAAVSVTQVTDSDDGSNDRDVGTVLKSVSGEGSGRAQAVPEGVVGGDGGAASESLEAPLSDDAAAPIPGTEPPVAAQSEPSFEDRATAGAPDADLAPGHPREIARDVNLELSTEPDELRDVADGVLEVTDRHNGFVVSSSVSSSDPVEGEEPTGSASFKLQIPAAELDATISELSDLAHVSSRSDGTVDITSRFRSAETRIEELSAERDRLLTEIEAAQTDERRSFLRSQLDTVRAQLDAAQRDLRTAEQRVDLVPVAVTVSAEEPADDGDWSISEALDDTVGVLTAVAGILLISAAILVPLALVALLIALVWRSTLRRRREGALDAD